MDLNRIGSYNEELTPRPMLKPGGIAPFRPSTTAYLVYSQQLSMLEAIGGQTCQAVVAGTHLSRNKLTLSGINSSLFLSAELLSLCSKKMLKCR